MYARLRDLRGRWARSRASVAPATPAPTPRTCGRTRSPPWPTSRPSASTCTTRSRPAPTGTGGDASWVHGRATSTSSPPPVARSPTWPYRRTSSSGSRARPTTTSSGRSSSRRGVEHDYAYTFIFSPRPGRGRIDARPLRRRHRRRRAVRAAGRVVVERSALARHRAASVAARTSCSKVRRKGSDDRHWAHAAEQARPRATATAAAARHVRGRSRSSTPFPPPAAWFIDVLAEPAHRRRIPVLAG